MKSWRLITVLLLCLALAGTIACSPLGGEQKVSQQLVKVVRGNLVVSVSGSGNIKVSKEAKLAFGVGGKVDKIYVEEGDRVIEGDVLARLDTDDLELALTQARVAVTSANVTLRTAKHSLDEARDLYTWPDIQTAQANVDDAKAYVNYVSTNLANATTQAAENMWSSALVYAQSRLIAAEAVLNAKVKSYDTEEVAIKKMQAELAQQSLEQAQQAFKRAQKQIGEAIITAPFNGVVASVYVDEGDVIPSPSVGSKTIIYLIDLNSMELKVEVDEIDMADVKLGQRAEIKVDALPNLKLEGELSLISLLPKTEAGVVSYIATLEFEAPESYGIRVGMSADADIITSERSNILLVPSRAINKDSEGNDIVEVMVNGAIQQRRVVTGISDDFNTEIIEGLSEGETVVIEVKTASQTGAGFF